ncbi:MAG: glycosyltransferase family 2 protein [Candidatus Promineifilaceae bacterium]
MSNESIQISVVMPTYNRLPTLKRALGGLINQTARIGSFEVVVVSDGSTDGTNEYLESFVAPFPFRLIIQQNQGAATARNTGFKAATGEYVLFIDDDVVPTAELVEKHHNLNQVHGEDTVIIGPMLTPDDYKMAPWVEWEQFMLYKQYEEMQLGHWQPTARQFYTGNTSLARKHLVRSGGFDAQFRRAEDVELAYRLAAFGVQFVFAPEAIGYHYADRSFQSWLSTPYAYGRNDVIFTLQKGQDWLLPAVFREFHSRDRLIQQFVRAFVGRQRLSQMIISILKNSIFISPHWLSRLICSGIFSLRYYQGVADELGGRAIFLAGVDAALES